MEKPWRVPAPEELAKPGRNTEGLWRDERVTWGQDHLDLALWEAWQNGNISPRKLASDKKKLEGLTWFVKQAATYVGTRADDRGEYERELSSISPLFLGLVNVQLKVPGALDALLPLWARETLGEMRYAIYDVVGGVHTHVEIIEAMYRRLSLGEAFVIVSGILTHLQSNAQRKELLKEFQRVFGPRYREASPLEKGKILDILYLRSGGTSEFGEFLLWGAGRGNPIDTWRRFLGLCSSWYVSISYEVAREVFRVITSIGGLEEDIFETYDKSRTASREDVVRLFRHLLHIARRGTTPEEWAPIADKLFLEFKDGARWGQEVVQGVFRHLSVERIREIVLACEELAPWQWETCLERSDLIEDDLVREKMLSSGMTAEQEIRLFERAGPRVQQQVLNDPRYFDMAVRIVLKARGLLSKGVRPPAAVIARCMATGTQDERQRVFGTMGRS